MEIPEFVETLDQEGRSLAAAAERAGPDAKVATCPGWQVRDLVRHTGMVHRWATAFVAERYAAYHPDGGLPELDAAELLAWFRDGHRRLVDTLAAAPPDLACWSFLPAPSPLAFWARRQAHETTVHRVDAQSALGETPGTVTRGFAVDGIDELLRGFHGRPRSEVRTPTPRVLRVRATDVDAVWTVRLSPEPPVSEWGAGAGGDVDCEMAGPAAGLYLALWNRLPFPDMTGDASLAALWREKSGITWG
ncbi:maleylpyruvate isomerase family mycothiol-dependent enzyme [Streptomyces sp. NPDC007896]|uniref:maleylpyruvate isomerase family mycothiol-dependent enzyme n=1 Tax=Streptomyces sp. NPDC007896 TaxID=3364784 RepID=UPI0036E77118